MGLIDTLVANVSVACEVRICMPVFLLCVYACLCTYVHVHRLCVIVCTYECNVPVILSLDRVGQVVANTPSPQG